MGMFKSLRGKTVAIVIASVLIMALVMGGIFIPKQIAITSDVIEDYMIDVAVLAGESIDAAKELHGDSVLDPKALRGLIASVNVRDFPSSYCYVVSADGTIIDHPDVDRIGAPVENEVIKGVADDVRAGLHPMPEYKETVYKGTKKVVTY